MKNNLWGIFAIILGIWESIAYFTKKIPTFSYISWHLQRKHGRKGKIPVLIFIMGLTKHLLRK